MNILSFIKSKSIWIICVLSFLSAFTYNEINLNNLPKDKIRDNQTIKTSDGHSYLFPAKNYIATGNWKENGNSKQSNFVRTPGYGAFYYTLLKVVGESNSLQFLKLIQLILFSLSVYCFYFIANELIKNKKIALITAAIYGCSPFAIGFLYYTLTEGISPALLLFYIFFLLKGKREPRNKLKTIFYFIASTVFAYLAITRPVLGIFGLLLPLFIIQDYWKKSFIKTISYLLIFGSISLSLLILWEIRNYKITNQYVGLYSIYFPDNNSIYRPTLEAFWNFNKCWGVEGHVYHSYSVPFWSAAIKGDTSEIYIKNIINTFPKYVVNFYSEQRLTKVFREYQKSILHQKKYYDAGLPMPMTTPKIELEVIDDFKQLTSEYKSEFWFQYHISSPLKVFKVMAFHSNLSLYIFQHTYRGNWLMEGVRLLFFGLHALCFISVFISLFFLRKKDTFNIAITLITVTYIVFLCYYQRGIEERYTLPILPLLLVGLVSTLKQIKSILRR